MSDSSNNAGRGTRGWLVPMVIIFVVAGLGVGGFYYWRTTQPKPPAAPVFAPCNSLQPFELVRDAFDQSNVANLERVHMVGMVDIAEVSFDATKLVRVCTGKVEASDSSKVPVRYSIEDAPDGQIKLRLTIMKQQD